MSRLSVTVSALALIGALASNSAEAVQRVFVASFGSDANTATNCGFANPCRGFAAAMTVVDPGGEVVALDAAGYGAVTITKSVTLTANPGFYAGISASSGNAVTINTAGVNVIVRGLNINGLGAGNGINMTNGASLAVENCVISNFVNAGILVGTPAKVRVADSVVRGNFNGIVLHGGATADVINTKAVANDQTGIFVLGDIASTTTTAAVSDSNASGNAYGMVADSREAGGTANTQLTVTRSTASNNSQMGIWSRIDTATAVITIGNSMVTGNLAGLVNGLGGTLRSLGNNIVDQNGTNITGTITAVSGL